MDRKDILAVSITAILEVAVANNVGYQGHCEIKPAQCLQRQPEQLHTDEHHPTTIASVSSGGGQNTTITPGSGTLSLSGYGGSISTAHGELTEGPNSVAGSGHLLAGDSTVAGAGSILPPFIPTAPQFVENPAPAFFPAQRGSLVVTLTPYQETAVPTV